MSACPSNIEEVISIVKSIPQLSNFLNIIIKSLHIKYFCSNSGTFFKNLSCTNELPYGRILHLLCMQCVCAHTAEANALMRRCLLFTGKKRDGDEEKDVNTRPDDDHDINQPRPLHRTNSIFLRNLAPTITKMEVEAVSLVPLLWSCL